MSINFKKIALTGVSALAIASYANTASAQPVSFEAGVPETLDITAEIDNTIAATITDPDMGTWGVIRSGVAGQQAALTLTPAGTQTAATSGTARTIAGGGQAAGVVNIAGAFPSTPISVAFSALVDLTCTACSGSNPPLNLYRVEAELTPPTTGVAGSDAVLDTVVPTNTVGQGTTTPAGDLVFNIGAAARTTVGANPYESGLYEGTYNLMLQY